MKNLLKKINVFSLAALFVALSIVSASAFKRQDQHWFAVNPDGSIGTYLGANATGLGNLPEGCGGISMQYCAVAFEDSEAPVTNVNDPDADDYIVNQRFRDLSE